MTVTAKLKEKNTKQHCL